MTTTWAFPTVMTWAVLTYLDIICLSVLPVSLLNLTSPGVALISITCKTGYHNDSVMHTNIRMYPLIMLLCSYVLYRLKRSAHGGCYSKVGLPLIENSNIVQQPLDLWTLTEQYKSAATRIIRSARYNTAAP